MWNMPDSIQLNGNQIIITTMEFANKSILNKTVEIPTTLPYLTVALITNQLNNIVFHSERHSSRGMYV